MTNSVKTRIRSLELEPEVQRNTNSRETLFS